MQFVERVESWLDNLNPGTLKSTIRQSSGKANLMEASFNLLIASLLPAALLTLLRMAFGFTELAILLISIVITIQLEFFIAQGIYWIFARAFGGSGSFTRQAYLMSLPQAALIAVLTLVMLFFILLSSPVLSSANSITVMSYLLPILAIPVLLYRTYLQYLVIKPVHKLNMVRAASAVLMPIFLFVLLVFF